MSSEYMYHHCIRHVGKPFAIRTRDGFLHRGIITHVNRSHAFLRPFPNRGNYGYHLFWGFGLGLGIGIALGAIVSLSLIRFW